MNIIEIITKNPIFPIATFLIGILVRTYFYYKSKKTKVIKYVLKSNNLVKDHTSKYSDLSIKYKNEEVKNFTITKMIIWNAGKETIHGKDITTVEPLKLKVKEGCKILEALVLKSNNNASSISITEIQNGNSFNLNFDYLDSLDGAVLSILHDGTISSDIDFSGKVKGLKKIVLGTIPKAPDNVHFFIPFPIHKDISKHSPNKRRFFYGLSHIGYGVTLALFFLLGHYLEHKFPESTFFNTDGDQEIPMWLVAIPSAFLIINGIYIMSKRLPKDLDLYEDV
jgi:hypothetical protein